MTDLLNINVNDHIEKKNGLTYLSWAWAWAEVLKIDPDAQWSANEYGPGLLPCCFLPDGTAIVRVSVFIKDKHKSAILPVMDYRNKAIKNPDAFAINTAIMRCLAKAIAMHGLGLYIYAGEDFPEGEESKENGISKDFTVSPTEEAFKNLQPEIQTLLRKAAPKIAAAMPEIGTVMERYQWVIDNYDPEMRQDIEAGLFYLLDSKTRAAIKAAQKEPA
jgi:hypothetical protein